ncbi:MAG: hypothetical protein AB7L84_00040 [Acidimicrobiia bacterium]
MPAETHQQRDDLGVDAVVELLAALVGIEPEGAGSATLAALDLDDDLALLRLWDLVAEELGERSLGDLDLSDARPATLGALAEEFLRAL